jgi:hypothetical protein
LILGGEYLVKKLFNPRQISGTATTTASTIFANEIKNFLSFQREFGAQVSELSPDAFCSK